MAYTTQSSFGSAPLGYEVTPWVKRLLIANAAVFLITKAIGPAAQYWLAFTPSAVLSRPWGAVTYMFVHGGLWHLLGNLIIIFFFGPGLEKKWGSSAFIKYYMVTGLGAVALSFLFVDASIIGASGAAYGLMLAFAIYWPEAVVLIWGMFPVKVKWLVGFMGALTLVSVVSPTPDGVAHLAHLGGLLTGFLYLRSGWMQTGGLAPRKPRRTGALSAVSGLRDQDARHRKREEKAAAKERDVLDAVDAVLDKISAHGIGSLTDKERALLDQVSKKQRTN